VSGGDRFALIDVLDTRFQKRPLGPRQRLRNFRHMIRYAEDRQALAEHWEPFRTGYGEAVLAGNPAFGKTVLDELLEAKRHRLGMEIN